ncbi:MAG: BrnA antitoxin family protein [Planktomarina sp.]
MKLSKMPKSDRQHASLMVDALRQIEHDVLMAVVHRDALPPAWGAIATGPPRKARKVTMWIDGDVIDFFKAMGPGYQPKMNQVLKAWMHGRLAKLIDGPDATDIILRPDVVEDRQSPEWGDTTLSLETRAVIDGIEEVLKGLEHNGN